MTDINVSTTTLEAIYDTTPNVNVSTVTIETLYGQTTPNVNVSTITLEVMSSISYDRFQGIDSEVLYNTANVTTRYQGVDTEVLYNVIPNARLQAVYLEVLMRYSNGRRRPVYVAASS